MVQHRLRLRGEPSGPLPCSAMQGYPTQLQGFKFTPFWMRPILTLFGLPLLLNQPCANRLMPSALLHFHALSTRLVSAGDMNLSLKAPGLVAQEQQTRSAIFRSNVTVHLRDRKSWRRLGVGKSRRKPCLLLFAQSEDRCSNLHHLQKKPSAVQPSAKKPSAVQPSTKKWSCLGLARIRTLRTGAVILQRKIRNALRSRQPLQICPFRALWTAICSP